MRSAADCRSTDPAPSPSTNLPTLRILMASRRPTFICVSSNGESAPGRAPAARHRTASVPYRSRTSIGVVALPFDFDIFLRSGSTTKPEMVACDHGTVPNSRCERTTVENSQVRMMSCACGRWSIGNTAANSSGSVSQPDATCGDSDDVAQVSITSGSPVNPPGTPRCDSPKPGGTSDDGSTGSDS